jgi:hypothetical protein
MPTITSTQSLLIVEDTDSYTEAYLLDDGNTIQLHTEDGETALDVRYTLEQAEKLHRALGHLLYLANQEA